MKEASRQAGQEGGGLVEGGGHEDEGSDKAEEGSLLAEVL